MKENYKTIASLVDLLDEHNTDGKIENLIGVSIDKCFIKSIANTIGTDFDPATAKCFLENRAAKRKNAQGVELRKAREERQKTENNRTQNDDFMV